MQEKSFKLTHQLLGAIPIIDPFMKTINLSTILTEAMGNTRYMEAIIVLVKNVMLGREALYAIQEWESQYDPSLLFGGKFGDDTFARALDRLFKIDRSSLLTRIVLSTIKAYSIDTSEVHQDTTSVSVTGAYENQKKKGLQLKRGHSKDRRPDLKQLVYELSVTKDGTIPIHYKTHDGNRTDDTLHWDNWQALRGVLGRSDFLYVADSKLCVSKVLLDIDRNQGRFITIMPRTRSEVDEFNAKVTASLIRWEKVFAKRSGRKSKIIDLYEVASGIHQMSEGFQIFWYRSSEKKRRDWNEREEKIATAMDHLRSLSDPMKKKKTKTEVALQKKVDQILTHFAVKSWVKCNITIERVEKFKQIKSGRATENTVYRKSIKYVPCINCSRDEDAIAKSEVMDGIFPLVTNTNLNATQVLTSYKHQPKLEKRHAMLKSGLKVAPIYLKRNDRIESLMFVYFIAQLLNSLMERKLRNEMVKQGLRQIQILPEDRPSSSPTAEQMIRIFQNRARHLLFSSEGKVQQTFTDPLSPIQKQVLGLLSVPQEVYE